MNAQFIILTHFSARYPKMPSLSNSFKCHTALAFDLMRVRLNDLNRIVQLVPTIDLVFKETDTDSKQEASDPRNMIIL